MSVLLQEKTKPILSVDEQIDKLKENGVTRVSIGVETFNSSYQKLINRKLSYKELENTIKLLKDNGITNINLDLMYGFENEYIEILDSKSQRLKKLTEDLVEASKVSTGNISLNLEKINVVELVKQATGEFEDKFKKRGLETIINADKNEVDIMADSRYMYRIIENLFSNVSKYALENSRVYIDIKQSKEDNLANNVIIEVKNISKDKLNISAEELMQRFVRGDKSRTTEGSGLGISIAQNLTELQKGKFELKLDGDLFKVKIIFAKV